MLFYFIVILVTVVDQACKIAVRLHMHVGESIVAWNGILNFTRYENAGAAGSMFQGYGRLFIIPAVLFVGYVVYARRKGIFRGRLMDAGLAFVAGGAIGNAIDRILFGRVTDFIEFAGRGGILNMADEAINVGVLLILLETVIQLIAGRRKSKRLNIT